LKGDMQFIIQLIWLVRPRHTLVRKIVAKYSNLPSISIFELLIASLSIHKRNNCLHNTRINFIIKIWCNNRIIQYYNRKSCWINSISGCKRDNKNEIKIWIIILDTNNCWSNCAGKKQTQYNFIHNFISWIVTLKTTIFNVQ